MTQFRNRVALLALLCVTLSLYGQNIFPKFLSGTDVSKPNSCDVPSFYQATDTNNLYVCSHGSWSLISGTSSSVSGVAISPVSLDFNQVQTGSNSQTQTVTITNRGTAASILVTGVTTPANTDFKSPNFQACTVPIPAGGNCSISVFVNPTGIGNETSSFTISTSASSPVTIQLTAFGTASPTVPLVISGTDTGFGHVSTGDGKINCIMAPPALPSGACGPVNYAVGTSVQITAQASAGSTLISLNGGTCSVSPCNLSMVSPGFTVVADFSENAPVNVPSVAIAPLQIHFGTNTNGQPSPVQNIAISNPNLFLPVTVNGVVISDSHFVSTNPTIANGVLQPGATVLYPLTFTPTAVPLVSATVTINTNAVFNPLTQVVSIDGAGTAIATFPLTYNASTGMTGSGTVTSNEATPLISCHLPDRTGQCSNNYASGAAPILTAVPDPNQIFGGFSGTGCGTTSPATVTVTAATTCTVIFTAPIPTTIVSLSLTGQGSGSITSDLVDVITGLPLNCSLTSGVQAGKCTATFNQGTTPILTEIPSGGGSFTAWGGGATCGTTSTCPVPIGALPITIGASFAPPAAGAPISLLQSIAGGSTSGTMAQVQTAANNAPSTGTTCAVTAANGLGATGTGNLLIYIGWPGLGNTLTGVSGGGTWVVDSNANHLSVAHSLVSTPGATTITGTFSGSTTAPDFGCRIYEISDAAGFALDTITAPATIATCNTCVGATPTVTGANDLILAIASQNSAGGAILGVNSGYSFNGDVLTGTGGARLGTGLLLNTVSTAAPSWNVNPAAAPVIYTITFKEIQTSVFGTFGSAQAAGSTNIVFVSWNDATTTISSISDTSGNTYTQSACSPKAANSLSEALYVAPNIAAAGAGVNKLKINFTASPTIRLIKAGEYSGLTTTPVDTCAGATGATGNPSSGNLPITTAANDLLVSGTMLAAGNSITSPSTSWIQRITASGTDVEDQQGVPIGIYVNAPTQSASAPWIDIAASYKNAGGGTGSTVSFNAICAGGGSGTSTSGGQTLTCNNGIPSGQINLTVASGSVQTINSSPLSGSVFTRYSGGGCGTVPQCNTQPITINTTVSVQFDLSGTQAYFVNGATGSDANDGLAATTGGGHGPWATIPGQSSFHSDSILVLGAGGTTVNVASGTYAGPITTNKSGASASRRIIYVSTTPGGAKITNANWNQNGSFTDVQNFDITSPATGNNYGISLNGVTNPRVLGNYFHDFDILGCAQFGVINVGTGNATSLTGQTFDAVIDHNIIRHMSAYGAGPNTCITAHAIYDFAVRTIITNNFMSSIAGPAIERVMEPGECGGTNGVAGVISNNTLINNGGAININQSANPAACGPYDFNTISNNIIVNNGIDLPVQQPGDGGLIFYHVTGTHNLSTNNMIYGNKPFDLGYHNSACGTQASGATPASGVPITGADSDAGGNGNLGGCPASSSQTDGVATSTFVNYIPDTPTAPITPSTAFNINNYKLKSTSKAVNNGSTLCTQAPGLSPCAPAAAYDGVNRPQGPAYDIGMFEQ